MYVICLSSTYTGVCQDLPVFLVHPQGLVYKFGDNVTLNCETDSPSDTIQWKLNGSEYDSGMFAGGTLTILSSDGVKQGYYSCVATRKTQDGSFTVSSAEAYIGLPYLTSSLDGGQTEEVVDSGSHTVLPCIPEHSSSPPSRFTWYRMLGNSFYSGFSGSNLGVMGPNGSAVLRRVNQAQIYRCQVDNDNSGQQLLYTTEVMLSENMATDSNDKMLVIPEDALVNLGDSLELYCIATDT